MKGIIRTIAKIEILIMFHNFLTVDYCAFFARCQITQSPESIDFHKANNEHLGGDNLLPPTMKTHLVTCILRELENSSLAT